MGTTQGMEGPLACPPRLNFLGQEGNSWNLNILLVSRASTKEESRLDIRVHGELKTHELKFLDNYTDVSGQQFFFWSCPVSIKQNEVEQDISYHVANKSYAFKVPGIDQINHFAMYSCNGYQTIEAKEEVGGISPMWEKLGALHEEKPLHLLIGGGDQIYADGVVHKVKQDSSDSAKDKSSIMGLFALPTIQKWLNNGNPDFKAESTVEMEVEITQFYFNQYIDQYNIPSLAKMQSSIAQLVSGDDHDFYDGCGSYPEEQQNSPVLKKIFEIAYRFYLLFQQHVSPQSPLENGFGAKGYSYLRKFNNGKLAVLALDTRSERTKDQIISLDTWKIAIKKILELPKECQHLLVVLAVPVVYPDLDFLLKIYDVADISSLISKLGDNIPGLKNQFGDWELRDDIDDHWKSLRHIIECLKMIKFFQQMSKKMNIRVTFISGDVHLAGIGKIEHESEPDIYQFITSPMGNIPAPSKLAKLLEQFKNDKTADGSTMGLINWDDSDETLIAERNFGTGCLTPRQRNMCLTLYPEKSRPLTKKVYQSKETEEVDDDLKCCAIQ